MTALRKYIQYQTERFQKESFKNHVATYLGNSPAHMMGVFINWQQPGTWNYGCRFILHKRWLIAVGDIGEAIFEWNESITPEFLLSLNFDYFMGKCQASPKGTDFEQWDSRVAFETMQECAQEEGNQVLATRFKLDDLNEHSQKQDYETTAREYYDDTGDAETAAMISGFGTVPDVHAIGIFVGLQMALAQLKAKEAQPV